MRRCAALLLALTLATPMRAAGLSVAASPSQVAWSGAGGACVYLVEAGGGRVRLGCSRASPYTTTPGLLYPGDLVEVRAPQLGGTRTGRAEVDWP